MDDQLDREITKEFTDEERIVAYRSAGMLNAKSSEKPCAIWLIGPSASGKSTLALSMSEWVGIAEEGYVTIDGEHFRDSHTGFQHALLDGQQKGCVFWGAYVGIRENINKEKQLMLEKACQERKHLMIPSTCLRKDQCIDVIKMLQELGYAIHIVGVYGDKDTIVKRGMKRAMEQGKRYDPREFEIALAMFAPMLRLCTGVYRMVSTTETGDAWHRVTCEGAGPLEEADVKKICKQTFKCLLGDEDACELDY